MRILMLAQWYPPIIGGEEGHVRALGQELSGRGHEVVVATLQQPGLASEEHDGPVRVVRIDGLAQRFDVLFSQLDRRSAQPFPDPGASRSLAALCREVRPDVVHAHNWLVHSYLPLKDRCRAPLIVTLHDYSLVCARKTLMRMGRTLCSGPGVEKCLRCAADHYGTAKGTVTTAGMWVSTAIERRLVDAFVPVSTAVAIGNGLPGTDLPWEVIPNFVRPDASPPRDLTRWTSRLPDRPYLLFVGAFGRNKGVGVLLDAYRDLQRGVPLVLIGYPTSETVLPRTLPPDVHVLEAWPSDAVMAAWRGALAGVVPSIWRDPCPTVAMEAMLAGRPVIASAIGGLTDIVADGESGVLVRPGDPTSLTRAMRHIIDAPDERERLAAGAAAHAPRFTADSIVPRLEDLYLRVQQAQPPSTRRHSESHA